MLTILLVLHSLATCPVMVEVIQDKIVLERIRLGYLSDSKRLVNVRKAEPINFYVVADASCKFSSYSVQTIVPPTRKSNWTLEIGSQPYMTQVR